MTLSKEEMYLKTEEHVNQNIDREMIFVTIFVEGGCVDFKFTSKFRSEFLESIKHIIMNMSPYKINVSSLQDNNYKNIYIEKYTKDNY